MSLPWTSLPNLHPAVVHVPLGILPLALAVDLLSLVWWRARWLDRMAAALYLVGALGAGAAVWAGERAEDSLVGVEPRLQPAIAAHSDWGHYTWYAFAALALLRSLVTWSDWRRQEPRRRPLRALLLAAAVVALLVLARAADLGGTLVYVHGVAVAAGPAAEPQAPPRASAPGEPAETAEPAESQGAGARLRRHADGGLTWEPAPGDHAALGGVVTAVQGTSLTALAPADPGGGASGLPLRVDGRVVLRLGDDVGDVQVEAELGADAFTGTIGVAHHLVAAADGGFFLLASDEGASLVDVRGGERRVLDAQPAALPAARFTLAVSSAGRHLKGMIDGQTVVHGHVDAPPAGGCGLVLDGTGVIRIHRLTLTPLAP